MQTIITLSLMSAGFGILFATFFVIGTIKGTRDSLYILKRDREANNIKSKHPLRLFDEATKADINSTLIKESKERRLPATLREEISKYEKEHI